MSELIPAGWAFAEFSDLFSSPVNDIVDGPFGSNLKASEYEFEGVPIARLQNIDRNQFIEKNIRFVSQSKADQLSRHSFAPGDVLITKLGDPLGKACMAPENISHGIIVADIVRARITHEWVDPKFLTYQINSYDIVDQFRLQTKGTTRPRVNLSKIRSLKVKLCPLAEQKRIVSKLDELFSVIESGTSELKAAARKLALYRQSLLKSALTGHFSGSWRAANERDKSGSELLNGHLAERRRNWEERQLKKFEQQQKTPERGWRAKYPQPARPEAADLPGLPEDWVWASIDQCAADEGAITDGPFGSNLKSSHYQSAGPRVIRLQNIGDGVFVDSPAHISKSHYEKLIKHAVRDGDVVVAMLGEVLPRSCVIPSGVAPAIVKADCARVRVNHELIRPYVLSAQLNSPPIREIVARFVKGVGRPRINLRNVRTIPVAVGPLREQEVIEAKLSQAFAAIDEQLAAINLALRQCDAQRQNILRSAFSGKLVQQNRNEESATKLLAHIRADRERIEKRPRKSRGRKKQEGTPMVRSLEDVLSEAEDWLPAQEVFRRCGIADGSQTDEVEALYAELRSLDKSGRLLAEPVLDAQGRKASDRLKLRAA